MVLAAVTDLDDEMCDRSASGVCRFVPPQRHRLVVKVHDTCKTQMSLEKAKSFQKILISPGSLGSLGGL